MVLVSVALCTYNGEKFIHKQIDSILSQTYKNIEVVIVDDASTDSTLKVIEQFAKRDARIKYSQNPTNIGFNANFEKAIKFCSGDYVAISDQDDIWLPNKIQALLETIGGNLLVHSNSVFMDESDNILPKYLFHPNNEGILYKIDKNFLFANHVTGHTCLLKRELVDKIIPFPEKCFYDWWIGFVAAYERRIIYKNAVLTKYREHPASVITKYRHHVTQNRYLYYQSEIEIVCNHLEAFSRYQNLSNEDGNFLRKLFKSYKKRKNNYFAFNLFSITYKHFNELFPGNSRKGIRKALFLFKYCRGEKMF
ncbi:glycosyltransferase family 2 protein [Olivibacter sp. LS-1]|uniref:glycosyltransferase family 2 protein n=1 Tax=Olivibacter TaxID=376469 RepID=UPI0011EAFB9B|nr:glycosyltransferase family 2 protein [Olivibacter sp. LS-1]QEL00975.1 glycosyltransferase family 2 protein [Olivibacter sp. LS-1]